MANNKVQLADGSVLIDLTDTTAVASDVAQGKYFYGADGVKQAGTFETGGEEVTFDDLMFHRWPNGEQTTTVTSFTSWMLVQAPLTRMYAPNCTAIADTCLAHCGIVKIYPDTFPKITKLVVNCFRYLTKTKVVEMPSVTTCNVNQVFQYSTGIKALRFQGCTTNFGGTNFVTGCTALRIIDLGPNTPKLGNVSGPANLDTIILRKTSGVTGLTSTNNLNSTKFAAGAAGGKVYVPSSLISQYEAATNWSTIFSRGTCTFVALEGSQYEDPNWDDSELLV